MAPDPIQQRALETWHTDTLDVNLQVLHATLGLAGEAGEVAELLKKDKFKPGHHSTRDERLNELGDVLYYLAILLVLDDCTFEELSQRNYAKLTAKGDNHGWRPDYANLFGAR